MEGILGIFQNASRAGQANLPIFLKALNEHQSLRQAPIGTTDFIANLTTLLMNRATKYEGLVLLEVVLKQCSLDILEQKGSLWATICIKTCSEKRMSQSVPFACRSLSILIEKSTDIPDLSKSFSGHLLSKFFELLNISGPSNHLDILKCIETGLRVYPGSCGASRAAIEKFVMIFVDSSDDELIEWSGKCLHLLNQVRGSGTAGISFKDAWQKFQLNLLGSLHESLDEIFANCPEVYDNSSKSEKLNVAALESSDEPIKRASQLFTRFKNLTTYLIMAITEPFPVVKPIMLKQILNFIQRGLAVNCIILERHAISDNLAIGALLPEIHIELYKLVDVLILSLRCHMALYVKMLLNFFLETLTWTNSAQSVGFTKPYSSLRSAAYKSLSLWNETMKYGSCCESIAENVIKQIKCDILPFQNEVNLKVLCGGKKHMSKKARRLLHKAQNDRSNISQTHSTGFNPQNTKIIFSDEDNQNLCMAALNCFKYIVISSSCFLKPIIIKDALDTIFSIAIDVLNNGELQRTKLYSNHICRQNLYSVVHAIISEPHYLCPPPIHLAIDIFGTAQISDHHVLVRSKCSEYLQALEKIIHPQKEGLCFTSDRNFIRNSLKNCKRNEQVLDEDENIYQTHHTIEIENNDDNDTQTTNFESIEFDPISEIDSTVDPTMHETQIINEEKPNNIHNISDSEESNSQIDISSQSSTPEVVEEFIDLSNESMAYIHESQKVIAEQQVIDRNKEPLKRKKRSACESDVLIIIEKGKPQNNGDSILAKEINGENKKPLKKKQRSSHEPAVLIIDEIEKQQNDDVIVEEKIDDDDETSLKENHRNSNELDMLLIGENEELSKEETSKTVDNLIDEIASTFVDELIE